MSVKVFVTIAAILFVFCNASTLPEAETVTKPQDAITSSKPQDPTTSSEPQDPTTSSKPQDSTTSPKPLTTTTSQVEGINVQQNEESVGQAACGGGCVFSDQCERYAYDRNCRCSWFDCILFSADADLTDVQLFESFIKDYSGNAAMVSSAEKAYRKRQ